METAIVELRRDVTDQLGRIRELGVELGLDEFGTGYASATQLHRLPLTFVKVDRSFAAALGVREDLRLVAAIMDRAASLGLRSVAQGIETTAQLDILRELGCVEAEGDLFSPPVPPTELGAALARAEW